MKQFVGAQLTDAAAEFAQVMDRLHSNTTSANVPAYTVINSYVRPSDTTSVIKIYDILLKRSGEILSFANDVEDEFIDDDLRSNTCQAIAVLRSTFTPDHFAAPWPAVKTACIIKAHIQTVKYFSRTMRAHRPIIKIDQDRIVEVKFAVNEAAEEVALREDLPEWARRALAETLQDLLFALENFILCGHDAVVDLILQLHSKAVAVSSGLDKNWINHRRLEKLAISLILLVDLFTSLPNIAQAIPVYKGWIAALSEVSVPLLAPPLKQIEGPKPPPSGSEDA